MRNYLLALLIITILALVWISKSYSQTIDCTQQQQQVSQLNSQINDATAALTLAQNNLSACQNINTIVESPAYATAVQSLQTNQAIISQPIYGNDKTTS